MSEWVNPDCRQAPHLLVLGTTMEAASLRLYVYKAAERVAPTDVSEALARGNAGHRLPKIARTFDELSGEPQAE